MSTKKLDAKNFLEQITKYGFFAEQFPECFSSKSFSKNVNALLPLVSTNKNEIKKSIKNSTAPTTLSTYKNEISRRVLSVPNPESFLRLAKYMQEQWENIKNYSYSNNSQSPISSMIYNYPMGSTAEYINSEALRETLRLSSDFVKGIKERINSSLGYKYRLCVDISNCYNSIYTHSITWAICGKKEAKRYFRTKQPESLKEQYEIGDRLDCFVRFQKNNETNGIIVGPYTSRIISEIILAKIDSELVNRSFIFKRYVDDYKLYFRSESQALASLPEIEAVLNEYNLSLNTSKTETKKFPYEIVSNIKEAYETAYDKERVFGVLNTASILFEQGEKGAYKYALKLIRDTEVSMNELWLIIPLLINIMLIDPRYGKYITTFLQNNFKFVDDKDLSILLNKELKNSLSDHL